MQIIINTVLSHCLSLVPLPIFTSALVIAIFITHWFQEQSFSGFVSCTMTNPIWFVKTRLQLDGQHVSALQCIKRIYAKTVPEPIYWDEDTKHVHQPTLKLVAYLRFEGHQTHQGWLISGHQRFLQRHNSFVHGHQWDCGPLRAVWGCEGATDGGEECRRCAQRPSLSSGLPRVHGSWRLLQDSRFLYCISTW